MHENILSPKYVGPPSLSHSHGNIDPGQYRSMTQIPVSYSSWPYGQSSPTMIGDYAVMKSASRTHVFHRSDFDRNGLALHWEESGPLLNSWKATSESNPPALNEYVKLPKWTPSSGIVTSFGERKASFHIKDTAVNKYVHDFGFRDVPFNDIGKLDHRAETTRQNLIKYFGTRDWQEFSSYLRSQGLEPEDIGHLAVGFSLPQDVHSVSRGADGEIIFYTNRNTNDSINEYANHFGFRPDEFRFDVFREELAHIWRKSYDRIRDGIEDITEEEDTKSTVRDFYLKLAEDSDGNPELARHYEKLASLMQLDIDTTRERYTERKKQGSGSEDLESRLIDEESSDEETSNSKVAYMSTKDKGSAKGGKYSSKAKVLYGKFDRSGDDYDGDPETREISETDAPKSEARSTEPTTEETPDGDAAETSEEAA